MIKHWLTGGILAALMLGLAQPALAQDDELAAKKAKKLAEPFLKSSAWHTDYDEALAAAAKSGKLIFAYFTRSYAP